MIKRKQRWLFEIVGNEKLTAKSQGWLSDINSIFPLKRLVIYPIIIMHKAKQQAQTMDLWRVIITDNIKNTMQQNLVSF